MLLIFEQNLSCCSVHMPEIVDDDDDADDDVLEMSLGYGFCVYGLSKGGCRFTGGTDSLCNWLSLRVNDDDASFVGLFLVK